MYEEKTNDDNSGVTSFFRKKNKVLKPEVNNKHDEDVNVVDDNILPPNPPIIGEAIKLSGTPPVISTYNQIKFDLYKLFQDYSLSYSNYKALESDNRHNTKEAKTNAQLMTSYALQFYGIVAHGWKDTKDRMREEEVQLRGEQFILAHGSTWNNYSDLMQGLMGGRFRDERAKNKYFGKRLRMDVDDLAICYQFMSAFIFFSGIGDIEGRFQEEESASGFKSEF